MAKRYYQDPWNSKKVWEVAKTIRSWRLCQYINGRPVSEGCYTNLDVIKSMGILSYKEITGNIVVTTC